MENFNYWPASEHPEVASDPLAVQPASQETLSYLQALIENKTCDEEYEAGEKGAELRHPSNDVTALAWQIESDSNPDRPDIIGTTHVKESIDDSGKTLTTYYDIFEGFDGLSIKKQVNATPEPQTSENGLPIRKFADWPKILDEAIEQEEELGWDTVSEREAQDLIAFLAPTESRALPR